MKAQQIVMEPVLVTAKQVCQMLQISPTKLWRLEQDGQFPKPLPSMGRLKRWPTAQVKSWARGEWADEHAAA